MDCDDFLPFLDVYIDGELDDRDLGEAEAHLEDCPSCRSRVKLRVQVKKKVRHSCSTDAAPDTLKNRICERVVAQQSDSCEQSTPVRTSQWMGYAFLGVPAAASIVFAVYLLFPQLTVAPATTQQRPIAEQTVDWHQGDLPLEVKAGSRGAISEWFKDKVEFPIRLPPFQGKGVSIDGGRLANIGQHRAAYVRYNMEDIELSVMIFNGEQLEVPSDNVHSIGRHDVVTIQANDYEVAVLQDGGLTYTITSKLSKERLLDLISKTLKQPS
jgi:mycothiol system anti-sigma-R factor